MKKILLLFILLYASMHCFSQYNKEKLTTTLTGNNLKSWSVSGINIKLPEMEMDFNINSNVLVRYTNGQEKSLKWLLKSSDNIRWYLSIGDKTYEMIVSYDKKGNEYIKLTYNKDGNNYQLKLNPIK